MWSASTSQEPVAIASTSGSALTENFVPTIFFQEPFTRASTSGSAQTEPSVPTIISQEPVVGANTSGSAQTETFVPTINLSPRTSTGTKRPAVTKMEKSQR